MPRLQPARRAALINTYKKGHEVVMAALTGITQAELDAPQVAGAWTPRQIVHHLADSEMTSAIRFRRLLAEDAPDIQGYDEQAFARHLYYERPIDASLDAMAAARRTTADMLDRLSDAEWSRGGTHSESGPYTVEDWLEIYAAHGHDHAVQIRRCRQPR